LFCKANNRNQQQLFTVRWSDFCDINTLLLMPKLDPKLSYGTRAIVQQAAAQLPMNIV
jgi:hypothetical protein